MSICKKCKTEIIENRCECGVWTNTYNSSEFVKLAEKMILAYDFQFDQGELGPVLGGDHFTGNGFVIFRGDFEMVERAKLYIKQMQSKKDVI